MNNAYTWYSAFDAPFRIDGMPFLKENGNVFHRLKIGKHYSEGVDAHAADTAGIRIRFVTDSEKLCIKATVHRATASPHISVYGSFGFDISVYTPQGKRLISTVNPERNTSEMSAEILLPQGSKDVIISLPQVAGVENMSIGIESGKHISTPSFPYSVEKPIVFYGSSITQGMSSSRSGTSFPALVASHFNCDYINLGFAGAAKGEQCVTQEIAQIEMSAFVMEYDHNADTPRDLADTHYAFYKAVRGAKPDIPIVMLSRISGGFSISEEEALQRVKIIEETFTKAKEHNDNSLFFINGNKLSQKYSKENMLVDGTHPNDLGMRIIADSIIEKLNVSVPFSDVSGGLGAVEKQLVT